MSDEQDVPRVPPPAGWYRDPHTGAARWWDGAVWGPVAAPPPRPAGDQNLAVCVLAHVAFLVFPVLMPLIFYLTLGKTDPRVREHSLEALNFQITFMVAWFASFLLVFVSVFAAATAGSQPRPFFLLIFPLLAVLYLGALVLAIVGAVRAGQQQPWRYPISVRLVGRSEG